MTTHDQLAEWADGQITRADPAIVSHWRIPSAMKALLVEVGVPVAPRMIGEVAFQSEAEPVLATSSGTPLYRLTIDNDPNLDHPASFGVEPDSGTVYFVLSDGEAWFANTSIELWLRTLHCYGSHLATSQLLSEPEEPEEPEDYDEYEEEAALAELSSLAEKLKDIDPAAFKGYQGFIWPELLDRWLY